MTYLGVNGYQFETNGHALLVDPYFTRAGLTTIAFQQRLEPNETQIAFGLRRVRPRVDAVLVTHAHFDHLLSRNLSMNCVLPFMPLAKVNSMCKFRCAAPMNSGH